MSKSRILTCDYGIGKGNVIMEENRIIKKHTARFEGLSVFFGVPL